MIVTSKITKKFQTTIPKAVVEQLGIKPSDRLVYEVKEGAITLRAQTGRVVDLAGKFAHFGKKPRRPLSISELRDAAADAAAASGMSGSKSRRQP